MVGVVASSKKLLLEQITDQAAALTGISKRTLFDTVMRRERLGSTGIGQGIAIPHIVHADLSQTIGLLAVLETPVDFDAPDRKPVDIVCLVIGPEHADSDHLKYVSAVARSFNDTTICQQLRAAPNADAALQCLHQQNADAA